MINVLFRRYDLRISASQGLSEGKPALPFLDFVRWVSALEVVLYHVRHEMFVDFNSLIYSGLTTKIFFFLTSFGEQAVAVFFALSGYLVGGSCIRRFQQGTFDATNYFIDRFSRIYLVLVPVLALSAVVGQYTSRPTNYREFICNLLNLQNNICEPLAANNALWSLSCEWFYYFSFPLLLLCWFRRKTHPIIASIFVVSVVVYSCGFGRVSGIGQIVWLLGAFAAVAEFRIPNAWLLMGALLFVAVGQVFAKNSIWDFLLCGGAASLLIRVSVPRVAHWPRLVRINQSLSALSYSLYLVHVPLMYLLFRWLLKDKMQPLVNSHSVMVYVGIVCGCLASAYVLASITERNTSAFRARLTKLFAAATPDPSPKV